MTIDCLTNWRCDHCGREVLVPICDWPVVGTPMCDYCDGVEMLLLNEPLLEGGSVKPGYVEGTGEED